MRQAIEAILRNQDGSERTSSCGDPARPLGHAPPTQTFQDLVCFDQWLADIETSLECASKDEIEAKKKSSSDIRGPIVDLIAACKSATGDLLKGSLVLQSLSCFSGRPTQVFPTCPQASLFASQGSRR